MEKEQQSTTLDSNEWQTHESVESEQHHLGDGMAIAQELRAEGGSEEGRSEGREGSNGGWAGEANEEGKGEELDGRKEEGEGSDKHEGEEREERREGNDEHTVEERNEEERKEEERKEEEEREDSDKYEGEERRGEGELRLEEHSPISMVHAQYTASQVDDENSMVWGDRTDDPLLQQGRNVDGPQVERELNTAQVPEDPHATLDQHSLTNEQLLFSQEKREDVSGEAPGGSRGVPEHIQQWRDEQQARMQHGGEPLPTPVYLAKENEGERTGQEQDVEAFDSGGREHRDSHAGEELRQEGHEQFPGQEREATGTSQDYLRSKDDGKGDIDEEKEKEEMVKEEEQGNMENLDLSQDTGQTPPPPLYDQSTHTDTLLPTPSTTYTPYPEVPPTSQSATHSVTASSSNFQEFDELSEDLELDETEDEDEGKDEDVEVRSLVTKSGKHTKVLFSRNGLVKVVEEGTNGYYLDLKSSQNGFSTENIDSMLEEVINIIGQRTDPVDHKEHDSTLDMHSHLPSSTPLSHSPSPSPEVSGSGHFPSPGNYLNVNVIRQRMLRDQQVHHTEPSPTDQAQPPPPTDQAQPPPIYQPQPFPPANQAQPPPPTDQIQSQPPTDQIQSQPSTDQAQLSPPTDQTQLPPTYHTQLPPTDQAQPPPPTDHTQLPPTNQAQPPPPTDQAQTPPPTDHTQLPPTDQAHPPPPTYHTQLPPTDQAQPPPTDQAQPPHPTDQAQPPSLTDQAQPFSTDQTQLLPTSQPQPPPTDHTQPFSPDHAQPLPTDHTHPPPTDHTHLPPADQTHLPPTDHTHPPPTDHTHPPPDEGGEQITTMTTGYDQTTFTFEAQELTTEQHTPTPSISPSVEIADTFSETPNREGLPGFVDTKDTGDTRVEADFPPSFPLPTQPSVQGLSNEGGDLRVLEMKEEDSVPAPLHPPLYEGDQKEEMEEEQQEQQRDEIETSNMERRAEEHYTNEEEKEKEEVIPEPREMRHLGGGFCCGYRCVAFQGTCICSTLQMFYLLQVHLRTTTFVRWCDSFLSHSKIGSSSR